MVPGIWGIFAVMFSNPDATFMGQLTGTVVIFAWMFIALYIVLSVINKVVKLRINEEEKQEGMDLSECDMSAYPKFSKEK